MKNQNYKMSKQLKIDLALGKFKSKEHKASYKAKMIEAELEQAKKQKEKTEKKV